MFLFCTELTLTSTCTTPSTLNKDTVMRFITTKYIDVHDDGTSNVVDVNGADARGAIIGDGSKYDNESILKALDDILGKVNCSNLPTLFPTNLFFSRYEGN